MLFQRFPGGTDLYPVPIESGIARLNRFQTTRLWSSPFSVKWNLLWGKEDQASGGNEKEYRISLRKECPPSSPSEPE